MKKTLLGLIAVLLLGVIAYFALQERNTTSTIASDEADFTVADTSQITRMFISSKDGRNFLFERQPNGEWLVNNSWQAEKGMVNMVLGTLSEMKVKAPVPKGFRNGVIRTLAGNGIKVELFTKDGILKTFYVGDSTPDKMGTYMIMHGSEQPYILHIPRFQGYLTTRFKIDRFDFMDMAIFEYPPSTVAKVTVDYPQQPEMSFSLSPSMVNDASLDSAKVKSVIGAFRKIHAEQFVQVTNEKAMHDSLTQVTPAVTIRVEGQNGKESASLLLYDAQDPDRMLGYVEKTQTYVWVQHFILKNVLKNSAYFQKPTADL